MFVTSSCSVICSHSCGLSAERRLRSAALTSPAWTLASPPWGTNSLQYGAARLRWNSTVAPPAPASLPGCANAGGTNGTSAGAAEAAEEEEEAAAAAEEETAGAGAEESDGARGVGGSALSSESCTTTERAADRMLRSVRLAGALASLSAASLMCVRAFFLQWKRRFTENSRPTASE